MGVPIIPPTSGLCPPLIGQQGLWTTEEVPSHSEEALGVGAKEGGVEAQHKPGLGRRGSGRGAGGPGRSQSLWASSGMGLTKPKPGVHCWTLLSFADTPVFSFTSSGAIFTEVQDK